MGEWILWGLNVAARRRRHATLPLGSDSAPSEASRVLKRHGWQTGGPRAMLDLETVVVPVTHQPVRTLPSPHAQGEL